MDLFIDHVWNGLRLKNETHLEDVRNIFISNFCNAPIDLCQRLSQCESESERIKLLKPQFQWKSIRRESFTECDKSSQVALKMIERADKAMIAKNFKEALRGYNLSAMFSCKNDENLGISFAQRSSVLIAMKKYKLALRDIELALKNKCPGKLLSEKKNGCSHYLELNDEAKNSHDEIHEKIAKAQNEYLNLKSPHHKIPCAEDLADIDYAEECGRRLLAKKNIDAGTLLMTENSYASVLTNIFIWETEYCHFCCKPILSGIPCEDCTIAIYCSEDCRSKACASFHRYETKFLCFFCNNPSTCLGRDVLALRVIFLAGPHELYRISKESSLYSPKNQIKGFNTNGVYESLSYLPIYHLISHPAKLRVTQSISNVFKAFVYVSILDDETDFFSQIKFSNDSTLSDNDPTSEKEMFKDFIASLILRHMENIPYNAISVSKLNRGDNERSGLSESDNFIEIPTVSYGMGLYSLLCLYNHSCDPNVVPLRSPNSTRVSVVALRNIKEGEELCICYGPSFRTQSTSDRREFLQIKYNFTCQCIACTNDWSNNLSMPHISNELPPKACCISKKMSGTDSGKMYTQILLAQGLIARGRFIDALKIIKPCLIFHTENYDIHSADSHLTKLCQDLFKLCLVWLFNSHCSC